MVSEYLANKIDLKTLSNLQSQLVGCFPLASFSRLMQHSADQMPTDTQISLAFSLNEQGQRLIVGKVEVVLNMVCQRCLEPFLWNLNVPIHLVQIPEGCKVQSLPEAFEWLEGLADVTTLVELLEDELLLALPVAVSHPLDQCDAQIVKQLQVQDTPEPVKQVESSQFFQALQRIQQEQSKKDHSD